VALNLLDLKLLGERVMSVRHRPWTCPEKVESTNLGTRRCSMGNGNRPTPEFRREAVRLALTSGRTRREIAEDLGIGLSTLTRWLREERDASEPSEAPVDVHAELKRLRRENAVLKQERDILKKAAAFFAKEGSR
jgi:transposase